MSGWGSGRRGKSTVGGVLTLVRVGYGVALLVAPGALIRLTGTPSRGSRATARVLGVRHLAQAGATAAAQWADPGSPGSFGLGAAVDLMHAASMIGLGAMDRRVRRTTFADAAMETVLAATGAWTATG